MGTITKRTNPSGKIAYRAQVRIKKAGYPDFTESRTFSKKQLAAEWLKRREAEIETNPEILHQQKKITMPTLQEASTRYLDEVGQYYAKNASAIIRFMMAFPLGKIRLNRLRRSDISDYAILRSKGVPELGIKPIKPSTINGDLQYLRSIIKHAHFSWGLDVGWTELDLAMEGLRRGRIIAKADKRNRLPTAAELQALTNYFYAHWHKYTAVNKLPMHLIIWFAIYSCRRQAEISRLRWDDFNRDARTWLVRDVKNPNGSKGNNLTAQIKNELMPVIDAFLQDNVQRRYQRTGGNVQYLTGGFEGKSAGAAFCNACKSLNIKDLRFHDLRHEGATRLAEDGLTIPQMQQVTLHESWASLERYVNLQQRPARLDFAAAMATAKAEFEK